VYSDGEALSHSQAKARFGTDHYRRWGAFGWHAAELLLQEGRSAQNVALSVWFDRQARTTVEELVRAVDPHARFSRRVPVATIEASLDEVQRVLAHREEIGRIEYSPPGSIHLSGI
jgi:hypothetical protein